MSEMEQNLLVLAKKSFSRSKPTNHYVNVYVCGIKNIEYDIYQR